ncbi:MAG TPA: YheU family protein [Cellvibrio sp.]|nr:YheU family protein [Cellvibrio sp.]
MIIPHQQISPEALRGLVEEFITREGTDYGLEEFSLAQKVQQVERQLARGEVVVVFDTASESVSLLTRQDAQVFIDQSV